MEGDASAQELLLTVKKQPDTCSSSYLYREGSERNRKDLEVLSIIHCKGETMTLVGISALLKRQLNCHSAGVHVSLGSGGFLPPSPAHRQGSILERQPQLSCRQAVKPWE